VKSCSQLERIEALALGELDSAESTELRAHVRGCPACRDELALALAERALFVRRAEVMPHAPAAPAFAAGPAPRVFRAPRVVPALARLLRRGHVSAACAAALFVVAAFSRLGNPAAAGSAASISPDDEGNASGMLASIARGAEPLACSYGAGPVSSGDDELSSSSNGALSSSPSQRSAGEALACEAREGSRAAASCEPSVTCSWARQ
jgi:hypothetical protein